jgi:hypothetical protein
LPDRVCPAPGCQKCHESDVVVADQEQAASCQGMAISSHLARFLKANRQ